MDNAITQFWATRGISASYVQFTAITTLWKLYCSNKEFKKFLLARGNLTFHRIFCEKNMTFD